MTQQLIGHLLLLNMQELHVWCARCPAMCICIREVPSAQKYLYSCSMQASLPMSVALKRCSTPCTPPPGAAADAAPPPPASCSACCGNRLPKPPRWLKARRYPRSRAGFESRGCNSLTLDSLAGDMLAPKEKFHMPVEVPPTPKRVLAAHKQENIVFVGKGDEKSAQALIQAPHLAGLCHGVCAVKTACRKLAMERLGFGV